MYILTYVIYIILTIPIILEMNLYHVIILFFTLLLNNLNVDICAEYLNVRNFTSIP